MIGHGGRLFTWAISIVKWTQFCDKWNLLVAKNYWLTRVKGDRSTAEASLSDDHFAYILVSKLGSEIGPYRLIVTPP